MSESAYVYAPDFVPARPDEDPPSRAAEVAFRLYRLFQEIGRLYSNSTSYGAWEAQCKAKRAEDLCGDYCDYIGAAPGRVPVPESPWLPSREHFVAAFLPSRRYRVVHLRLLRQYFDEIVDLYIRYRTELHAFLRLFGAECSPDRLERGFEAPHSR